MSTILKAVPQPYLPIFLESIVVKSAQTNLIKSGFKKKHSFSVSHECIVLYILLNQKDYGTVTESTNTDIKSDVCTSEKVQ